MAIALCIRFSAYSRTEMSCGGSEIKIKFWYTLQNIRPLLFLVNICIQYSIITEKISKTYILMFRRRFFHLLVEQKMFRLVRENC